MVAVEPGENLAAIPAAEQAGDRLEAHVRSSTCPASATSRWR